MIYSGYVRHSAGILSQIRMEAYRGPYVKNGKYHQGPLHFHVNLEKHNEHERPALSLLVGLLFSKDSCITLGTGIQSLRACPIAYAARSRHGCCLLTQQALPRGPSHHVCVLCVCVCTNMCIHSVCLDPGCPSTLWPCRTQRNKHRTNARQE